MSAFALLWEENTDDETALLREEVQILNDMLQETWFTAWDEGYARAREDAKRGRLAPAPAEVAKANAKRGGTRQQETLFA